MERVVAERNEHARPSSLNRRTEIARSRIRDRVWQIELFPQNSLNASPESIYVVQFDETLGWLNVPTNKIERWLF